MTEQDQQKALAELDGWTKHKHYDFDYPAWIPAGFNYDSDSSKGIYASPYNLIKLEHELPKWTSSYDAIIPLIQKQIKTQNCGYDFSQGLRQVLGIKGTISPVWLLNMTPAQLCEALLRATNLWKE